ncbi:MAG: glycosyltransferase family 4 protein [Planctomycetota bacterium]
MHALFTADHFDLDNLGGAGRVLWELVERFVRRGHDVSLVAGSRAPAIRRLQTQRAAFQWISFPYPLRGARGAGFFFNVRRDFRNALELLSAPPDVVIHNQPLTGELCGERPERSVYIFHSPWPAEYLADRCSAESARLGSKLGARTRLAVGARRFLERRVVERAGAIVTLSQHMRERLVHLHRIDEEKVHVCPGGVDLAQFQSVDACRRAKLRAQLQVAPEELLLVSVRRLVHRTGIDLLLDALALLSRETRARFRVILAGRGPLEAELRTRSRGLGLNECVRFAGYVSDDSLAELYAAADLAVVPTRALEGFGLSTLEALACGTPVLATAIGGSVEILRGLDERLLCAEATPQSLAGALFQWATDRAALAALRARCRPFVEANYSWDEMTDRVEALAVGEFEPALA